MAESAALRQTAAPAATPAAKAKSDDKTFDYLQGRIITHWPEARQILDGEMPAPRTAIV